MRTPWLLALLLCSAVPALRAQDAQQSPPTLTVRSNLVEVPAIVKTKKGEIVFALTANDFTLTDDGVPQRLHLLEDTDSEPLALAVVVETGGAGANHLGDYHRLGAILGALAGGVDHRVEVIGFDSRPHVVLPFTTSTDNAAHELANLQPGDPGAAILDAVAFAVNQLRAQPARYRRAILLFSETLDQDSNTTLGEALHLITDTNTAMYSFAFRSTKAAMGHEATKFNRPNDPGPAHGCFSRGGADAEYNGHYGKQVLDCISELAPPLRLATMAFIAARDGLRRNTAESIASLTGGEFFRFHNAKDLQARLISASNDVPNYYILTFTPSDPTPGPHALHLTVNDRPQLEVRSRSQYWIDTDTPR